MLLQLMGTGIHHYLGLSLTFPALFSAPCIQGITDVKDQGALCCTSQRRAARSSAGVTFTQQTNSLGAWREVLLFLFVCLLGFVLFKQQLESFLCGIFRPTFVMIPFSDLKYYTSELKKSNTISKVEGKQGGFCPGPAMNIWEGDWNIQKEGTHDVKRETHDVKNQSLGVLVKSARAGPAL